MHGSAQRPNGSGKILAGEQQVLASLLRAMSTSKLLGTVRFSGYSSAIVMMVAPENDEGP
jgi:hypothetical protein